MDDSIRVEGDGAVRRVTLNRADKRNAFDRAMWDALREAFADIPPDGGVRAVLLDAAGPAFSAGADIAEFRTARRDAREAASYGTAMEAAYDAIVACPVPVVAAVGGGCTGAGLVLALLADLRLAAADARFGIPVSRLGLAMPLVELAIVTGALGRARTLDLLLSARLIGAEEALAWGIVTRVVAPEALASAAAAAVHGVAAGPRRVNALHKRLVGVLSRPGAGPPGEAERRASYAPFDEADYREGIAAFLEKRPPRFAD